MAAVTFPHPTAALVDADRRIMREWLLALQSVTTGLQSAADALAALAAVQPQIKRVTAQFDKTNDTTLSNVSGLSINLGAGVVYVFRASLFVATGAVAGGAKYAIGTSGALTATSIAYEVLSISNTPGAGFEVIGKGAALGASVGRGGTPTVDQFVTIEGLIVVNIAGPLTVQFAQNVANGTSSSVLVGSYFQVSPLS